MSKKLKGQFYTTNSSYILEGFDIPSNATRIIEPFAGKGDLINWASLKKNSVPIEAYDIEPKKDGIIQRDTLNDPPNYKNAWVLTNPPYLARNKCSSKDLFNKYETNDLYKCFIHSLTETECIGGLIIIPAGFFLSPRNVDTNCRNAFLSNFKVLKIKYFEETVFSDTTTTVVAVLFERSSEILISQDIYWTVMPSNISKEFTMKAENNWIIGGDIYNIEIPNNIKIRRHVAGQQLKDDEQLTSMTLTALDSGKQDGRICLTYKEGYAYPAKDCSRSYATLCIKGRSLSNSEQMLICSKFNTFIEEKRSETWSLFLPQFRESKEYARKRIPFELAYRVVLHLISNHVI